MPTERINKVAEAIKQEVAQILQQEIKDPRIGFITVTRVKVAPDLRHATIYYSLLEGRSAQAPGAAPSGNRSQGTPEGTEAGLKSSLGFIRRLLGDRLRLRVTPELIFRLDASIKESIRMSKLLDELNKPGQR